MAFDCYTIQEILCSQKLRQLKLLLYTIIPSLAFSICAFSYGVFCFRMKNIRNMPYYLNRNYSSSPIITTSQCVDFQELLSKAEWWNKWHDFRMHSKYLKNVLFEFMFWSNHKYFKIFMMIVAARPIIFNRSTSFTWITNQIITYTTTTLERELYIIYYLSR